MLPIKIDASMVSITWLSRALIWWFKCCQGRKKICCRNGYCSKLLWLILKLYMVVTDRGVASRSQCLENSSADIYTKYTKSTPASTDSSWEKVQQPHQLYQRSQTIHESSQLHQGDETCRSEHNSSSSATAGWWQGGLCGLHAIFKKYWYPSFFSIYRYVMLLYDVLDNIIILYLWFISDWWDFLLRIQVVAK